jgi:hypothetical protein
MKCVAKLRCDREMQPGGRQVRGVVPQKGSFRSLGLNRQELRVEMGPLRDLFCLLLTWSRRRVLELAPVNWKQTLETSDAQQRLDANVFRRATLGLLDDHRPNQ